MKRPAFHLRHDHWIAPGTDTAGTAQAESIECLPAQPKREASSPAIAEWLAMQASEVAA